MVVLSKPIHRWGALRRLVLTTVAVVLFVAVTQLLAFSVFDIGQPELLRVGVALNKTTITADYNLDFPRTSSESSTATILLVTYVFGNNKVYLRMFVESAATSGVDLVIVGDMPPLFELPPNVRYFPISWDALADRVQQKVLHGKQYYWYNLLEAPRFKVNDFKPLFAFLFPELVPQHQYEWWGHVDNDMLLGNVSHFLPKSLLDQYDMISPLRGHSSLGPFMLYRNKKVVNELFLQSDMHLGDLFANPKPVCFDEWGQCGLERWGAHMSGIINKRAATLGLRPYSIARPSPFVWDGICEYHYVKNLNHCAGCVYRNSTLFATTHHDKHDGEPMLFCHYEFSKARLESSLDDAKLLEQLLQVKEFAVDFLLGFHPVDVL